LDIKIIYQNNYVEHSSWLLEYQNLLQYCSSYLNFPHNYFDGSTKLFSDLYLSKFLDTLTKSFFPYTTTRKCSLMTSIYLIIIYL